MENRALRGRCRRAAASAMRSVALVPVLLCRVVPVAMDLLEFCRARGSFNANIVLLLVELTWSGRGVSWSRLGMSTAPFAAYDQEFEGADERLYSRELYLGRRIEQYECSGCVRDFVEPGVRRGQA